MPPAPADVGIKACTAQFNQRLDRDVRAVATPCHTNMWTLFDARPKCFVTALAEGEAPKGSLPLDETCVSLTQRMTRHLLTRMRTYRLRKWPCVEHCPNNLGTTLSPRRVKHSVLVQV